jgi:hypothetical protein
MEELAEGSAAREEVAVQRPGSQADLLVNKSPMEREGQEVPGHCLALADSSKIRILCANWWSSLQTI